MGKPVRIRDLATQMIELSGLVPEKDIPIRYNGLRLGEKLYEELLIDPEQACPTPHPRIFCSDEPLPESNALHAELELLTDAINRHDTSAVLASMQRLVPEYGPEPQAALHHSASKETDSTRESLLN